MCFKINFFIKMTKKNEQKLIKIYRFLDISVNLYDLKILIYARIVVCFSRLLKLFCFEIVFFDGNVFF